MTPELIPSWLPCYHCRHPHSAHIDTKCPFEATSFNPSDSELILEALAEMNRKQAWRPPKDKTRPKSLSEYQERRYRDALEIVMERWLKEWGID